MALCKLANSRLSIFLCGEMMFTAAFFANRARHSALGIRSSHKMLKGADSDIRHPRVTGVGAFIRIERRTQKPAAKAVKGRLTGSSNDSKSCSIYTSVTRRIMGSKNVVFIDTSSRFGLPGESQPLIDPLPLGDEEPGDSKGLKHAVDDASLCDLRDDSSVLIQPARVSADHVTASGVSRQPQITELMETTSVHHQAGDATRQCPASWRDAVSRNPGGQ